MVSNLRMQPDICYAILFCLSMSSARSSFLSVSHHGPHVSIGELRNFGRLFTLFYFTFCK